MSLWKLIRIFSDNEEYTLPEGEITIGRGIDNHISTFSVIVSREHSVLYVENNEVSVKDLGVRIISFYYDIICEWEKGELNYL